MVAEQWPLNLSLRDGSTSEKREGKRETLTIAGRLWKMEGKEELGFKGQRENVLQTVRNANNFMFVNFNGVLLFESALQYTVTIVKPWNRRDFLVN